MKVCLISPGLDSRVELVEKINLYIREKPFYMYDGKKKCLDWNLQINGKVVCFGADSVLVGNSDYAVDTVIVERDMVKVRIRGFLCSQTIFIDVFSIDKKICIC